VSAAAGDCAEVLLDRAAGIADRPLTYRVPAGLHDGVTVGVRALVPLGARTALGFVVATRPCDGPDPEPGAPRIRDLLDVLDPIPLFSPVLLELARWVAEETLSTLLDAIRCLVPPEVARRRPAPRPLLAVAVPDRIPRTLGRRQQALVALLLAAPLGMPVGALARGGGGPSLKRLVALGAIRLDDAPRPEPVTGGRPEGGRAVATGLPVLLWGDAAARAAWIVDAVRETAARGGQAIVTVPEVELAGGLAAQLRAAVGDRVALFHSELAPAAHRETWARIREGAADVVCGTRSALFAPLGRLGLLVVDDEQDRSYKADAAPRYLGRAVALRRGALEGAGVVLGSASPSVETYAAADAGAMRTVRVASGGLPRVTIVDMRREHDEGRPGTLSQALIDAMRGHLRAGGRVALFINRVGYARVLLCQECGHVVRCPRCLVPMPFDREADTIRCRVCGRTEKAPQVCPRCKGVSLRWIGAGTKRVEEVVARVFPDYRLARVDRETAGEFDRVAREFAAGRLRLVVGTQLLARGRRLRPSLVGVVDADVPLYRPDFRAAERAFQQLHAVLGLAGGPPAPDAFVQTRAPEHPVLEAIRTGADDAFYRDELRARREFGYPPFAALARVVASGRDLTEAGALAARAAEAARAHGAEVLGPSPADPAGGHARVQCLLRAGTREVVRDAARAARDAAGPPGRGRRGGRLAVDIDPQEIA